MLSLVKRVAIPETHEMLKCFPLFAISPSHVSLHGTN